jgi:hypothetical protein
MIEERCHILAGVDPDSSSLVSARLEVSGDARSTLLDFGSDVEIERKRIARASR